MKITDKGCFYMNLYAPKYYKNFACKAQNCKHSCCVDWEIDIDNKTLARYKTLNSLYKQTIDKSIEITDSAHFKLAQDKKCPHLNEDGLCNIIINVGEDYLCDICREHPRFYNFTNNGKEVGLGISCEEACRVILNSDDYDRIEIIGEAEGAPGIVDFNAISERDTVYKILKYDELDVDGKIGMIYDYYDIYLEDARIRKALKKLEYLNNDNKELFLKFNSKSLGDIEERKIERLIAYFVYRYCSEAESYDNFVTSLSFSLLCTFLIISISNNDNIENMARIASEEIEYSQDNVDMLKGLFR